MGAEQHNFDDQVAICSRMRRGWNSTDEKNRFIIDFENKREKAGKTWVMQTHGAVHDANNGSNSRTRLLLCDAEDCGGDNGAKREIVLWLKHRSLSASTTTVERRSAEDELGRNLAVGVMMMTVVVVMVMMMVMVMAVVMAVMVMMVIIIVGWWVRR
jgi:hypothetical protein